MPFLDLLYKRYPDANGYLDRAFKAHRLKDAINETIKQANDERTYDLWKARCFDKSYEEFKAGLSIATETRTQKQKTQAETVSDSFNILATFEPY